MMYGKKCSKNIGDILWMQYLNIVVSFYIERLMYIYKERLYHQHHDIFLCRLYIKKRKTTHNFEVSVIYWVNVLGTF